MILRRQVAFSAGDSGALTGRPGGHNYVCELGVSGEIDPSTGMVVNITLVDAILKSRVVRVLDGTIIDRDVAAFRSLAASPPNLARFIWGECEGRLPYGCRLVSVRLAWKPTAWVTMDEQGRPFEKWDNSMVFMTRVYDFSASHRLHATGLSDEENLKLFGKCNWPNGHGHNYEIEVTVAGDPDASTGQVGSIDLLDRIVDRSVITPFDHRHLNLDVPEFADTNPTSENLAIVIWNRIAGGLRDERDFGARLYRVAVRETARNYFEYFGDAEQGRQSRQ